MVIILLVGKGSVDRTLTFSMMVGLRYSTDRAVRVRRHAVREKYRTHNIFRPPRPSRMPQETGESNRH